MVTSLLLCGLTCPLPNTLTPLGICASLWSVGPKQRASCCSLGRKCDGNRPAHYCLCFYFKCRRPLCLLCQHGGNTRASRLKGATSRSRELHFKISLIPINECSIHSTKKKKNKDAYIKSSTVLSWIAAESRKLFHRELPSAELRPSSSCSRASDMKQSDRKTPPCPSGFLMPLWITTR